MTSSAVGGIRFGQYTLLRRIARGGMAEVFLAQQKGLEGFDRRVAVKRILPHLADAPDFVKMFLGEAKLAAQLTHPNVVHIYDFGKHDGDYFIAMEYVEGVHAGQLFKFCAETEKLPPVLVARLGADAAAALHYAHELRGNDGKPIGLVHRDVSPANLMVSYDGIVKLCDFGIAKAAALGEQLTNPGQVKGKYAYMSPEQTIAAPLDGRSDVFSLAIVMWELLAGKTIVGRGDAVEAMRAIRDGKLPSILNAAPKTPPALAKALGWAMATRRENRATAMDFAQALEAYIKSSPELATSMQLAGWIRTRFPREHGNTGQHAAMPGVSISTRASPGTLQGGTETPRDSGTAVAEGTSAAPDTPAPVLIAASRMAGADILEGADTIAMTEHDDKATLLADRTEERNAESMIVDERRSRPRMQTREPVRRTPASLPEPRARAASQVPEPRARAGQLDPRLRADARARSASGAPLPRAEARRPLPEPNRQRTPTGGPRAGEGIPTPGPSGEATILKPLIDPSAPQPSPSAEMTAPRGPMSGSPSSEMTAMSTPMPQQTTTDREADAATRNTMRAPTGESIDTSRDPRGGGFAALTEVTHRGATPIPAPLTELAPRAPARMHPRNVRVIAGLAGIAVVSFIIALAAKSCGTSAPATVDASVAVRADAAQVALSPDAAIVAVDAAIAPATDDVAPVLDPAHIDIELDGGLDDAGTDAREPTIRPDAGAPPTSVLEVHTQPTGGVVTVSSIDEVRIDPARFALEPGRYQVTAEFPGYLPEKREVVMERGLDVVQEIVFTRKKPGKQPPQTGKLTARTVPYSAVYMNGKLLGETPFAERALPVGSYTLTFKNPDKGTVTKKIKITANKTTKVNFTFP
ncbi:MAG: protein kinase [Kofleriaceae bacterium]